MFGLCDDRVGDHAVDGWDTPELGLCPLIGSEANTSPRDPNVLEFPATCLLKGELAGKADILPFLPELELGICGEDE